MVCEAIELAGVSRIVVAIIDDPGLSALAFDWLRLRLLSRFCDPLLGLFTSFAVLRCSGASPFRASSRVSRRSRLCATAARCSIRSLISIGSAGGGLPRAPCLATEKPGLTTRM